MNVFWILNIIKFFQKFEKTNHKISIVSKVNGLEQKYAE